MIDSQYFDPQSPKTVQDIVGNTEIWTSLNDSIQTNQASHLIVVGPAGCGKTLFLRLALAKFQTLFVDCTANFGLRDVRDSIRIFSRGGRSNDGKLRWIIFEHADSLTSDTQAFLRRMLETTSNTTRTVFECRDAGAISEPIVSRSTVVSVSSPEMTEGIYELMRRTQFKLQKEVCASIMKHNYGNMRSALLNALAVLHCNHSVEDTYAIIRECLETRPSSNDGNAWIEWAIKAETSMRLQGIDLREILQIGWPNNPFVSNTCLQWSRLGGTSPRTLFFNCISKLIDH